MNRNILLHLRLSIIFSILIIFMLKVVIVIYPDIGYGMLLVSPALILTFQILFYYLTSSNFIIAFIGYSLNSIIWIQQIFIINNGSRDIVNSAIGVNDYIFFFLLYGLIFALNKIWIEKAINLLKLKLAGKPSEA